MLRCHLLQEEKEQEERENEGKGRNETQDLGAKLTGSHCFETLETLLTDDTPLVKQWRPDHMSSKIFLAKINDTIEMEKVKMCVCVVLS